MREKKWEKDTTTKRRRRKVITLKCWLQQLFLWSVIYSISIKEKKAKQKNEEKEATKENLFVPYYPYFHYVLYKP